MADHLLKTSNDGNSIIRALPENALLEELKGADQLSLMGSFDEIIQAIAPQDVFLANPSPGTTITQRKPSWDFRLFLYLVTNNFVGLTSDVSKIVFKLLLQHRSNGGLLEYILQIGGPTVEVLSENLFQSAIDAGEVPIIQALLSAGVNPNEKLYRRSNRSCCTPLLRACEMQRLEIAKALIDGGANVHATDRNEKSLLVAAIEGLGETYGDYDCVKGATNTKLVELLLGAGASVNSGSRLSPLSKAVRYGNFEVVKILVSAGADINLLLSPGDGDEYYPIFCAIWNDEYISDALVRTMVEFLLDNGADINATSINDGVVETVLESAIHTEDIALTRLLLGRGSVLTDKSLQLALKYWNFDMVKLYLDYGSSITCRLYISSFSGDSHENPNPILAFLVSLLESEDKRIEPDCKTPILIQVISCGDFHLAGRLLGLGVKLQNTPDFKKALENVIEAGEMNVLLLLLNEKSGNRTITLESLDTELWVAIRNNRNDITQLLIKEGVSVESQERYPLGCPLLAAIHNRDRDLALQLLDAGATVTGVLGTAIEWGEYILVQKVMDAGADVESRDSPYHPTPLQVAVRQNDREIIDLLLDVGANVNSKGSSWYGRTALNIAIQKKDVRLVQYLLNHSADPDEESLASAVSCSMEMVKFILAARLHHYQRYSRGYGCTALKQAMLNQNVSIINLLLTTDIDLNLIREKSSALGSAAKVDNSKDSWLFKLLLGAGADPNRIVTDDHQTGLLVAIRENNLGAVGVLLAAGADANPTLRFGVNRTPLQLAVEKCRTNIVGILINHGADVNTPRFPRYGATALQFAAIGGFIGIARTLLAKGADVNAPAANIGGRTALEGAAEHGRIDMLQLLLNSGALVFDTGEAQYNRARELAQKNGHRAACRLLERFSAELLSASMLWEDIPFDL